MTQRLITKKRAIFGSMGQWVNCQVIEALKMTSENISGFQVPKSDFWRLTHTQTMKARVGFEIRWNSTKIHWFRFVHHDYQRDINGAEIWKDPEKLGKQIPPFDQHGPHLLQPRRLERWFKTSPFSWLINDYMIYMTWPYFCCRLCPTWMTRNR